MAGLKRKDSPRSASSKTGLPQKKQKLEPKITKSRAPPVAAESPESGTTEDDEEDEFDGLESDAGGKSEEDDSESSGGKAAPHTKSKANGTDQANGDQKFKEGKTSAESHAAQRAIAKERKASKPNADSIQRSKKIWERLRRQSHVPLDERKALVAELFDIITGRMQDFVYKHDSVRVIQCALKYANKEQRRQIVKELQSDLRPLAESKYGKFLVGKMVVEGDKELRDMIIPEFYGHVRRLINHPEAAWIVDDIYRQIASSSQKALMLREWYGAEFAVFGKTKGVSLSKATSDETTSDLAKILATSPEKKKTIMQYLHQLINQLIQKKMTGFTMLHDAMLQYFLNTTPGSSEANEFLELLKSDLDEEGGGDLLKNLAFTKSGSRVVCLALAYGTAKDRKIIMRVYKDTIEMMAFDAHAHTVLLAAMDVTDDTRTSTKSILPELLGENIADVAEREQRLLGLATHLTARLPLLYPLAGQAKWLLNENDEGQRAVLATLAEVHAIRVTTSKKNADTRRLEIVSYISPSLLTLVEHAAAELVASSFGAQAATEILLESSGDKSAACAAVANLCAGDPTQEGHVSSNPAAGKMLRTLVQGGKFDPVAKAAKLVDPPLGFGETLFRVIEAHLLEWATGKSSFVVVALVESRAVDEGVRGAVVAALKKGRKALEKAAAGEAAKVDGKLGKSEKKEGKGGKKEKIEVSRGNAGAKILLGKLDG